MTSIFCCSSTEGYKNKSVTHEAKFASFLQWANYPRESSVDTSPPVENPLYAVQVVKQVNFGPLESKRYFIVNEGGGSDKTFVEVSEKWLIDANFQKLNTYKNFKCSAHNKFFEVNVYQKDPVNVHHWRANVTRPAADIDL